MNTTLVHPVGPPRATVIDDLATGRFDDAPSAVWTNREGLTKYDIVWRWPRRPAQGITAVLRVKNEARSLPWVLPGVLRAVSHVLLVDNGSTDGTPDVARDVAQGLDASRRLRILKYPFSVARCGSEHLATHPDSVRSLTYYYNWSFSHVRTRYALKWDGDMVLTDAGEQVLRELAWQLEAASVLIRIPRPAVYVATDQLAYVDMLYHPELFGWPNTSDHTFIKGFDWEIVRPHGRDRIELPPWVTFELKWLDEDIFDHWSNTDFGPEAHGRKRQEWEIYHALRGEGVPPERLVRVESPEGTHVIDHVRATYTMMRPIAAGSARG